MVSGVAASAPPGEGGALGAVDRFVAKIENIFNAIGAAFIVIVMVYMCAEVISRKADDLSFGLFEGRPLPGVIDWIELLWARLHSWERPIVSVSVGTFVWNF